MAKDAVQTLIDNIVKAKITASRLSDDSSPCVVNAFLSTGCIVLDAIMGGGLPMGRIVEIYGDTSTGKSLIAAQACATVQEDGGLAVRGHRVETDWIGAGSSNLREIGSPAPPRRLCSHDPSLRRRDRTAAARSLINTERSIKQQRGA